MRTSISAILGTLFLAACSSSNAAPSAPSLFNTWAYASADGSQGIGYTFASDGTYLAQDLHLTSANSGEDQVEQGTFSTADGLIRFVPTKSSCALATLAPYSATYGIKGNTLTLAFTAGGLLAMTIDTSTPSTFALSTGCFESSGAFTPEPVATLGSCQGAGETCASSTARCCEGTACTTANGGTCAATCTLNSQCTSGCCVPIDNAPQSVCAPCPIDGGL